MIRIVEILIAINALGGIATFLGFRMAARKTKDKIVGNIKKIGEKN
jgi:hypothetical protein